MARLEALLERSRMGREWAAERAARRQRSAEEMRCCEQPARCEQVDHQYGGFSVNHFLLAPST